MKNYKCKIAETDSVLPIITLSETVHFTINLETLNKYYIKYE